MEEQSKKITRRERPSEILHNMALGQVEVFPAEQYMSIKTMATMYGFQWGRKFRVSIDHPTRSVNVTRLS
ncbi:MAG: hypothetical protein IJF01_07450 [Tidjanibacter sp.]|nr:hypothetical protein [Tidjanibacter sp.]